MAQENSFRENLKKEAALQKEQRNTKLQSNGTLADFFLEEFLQMNPIDICDGIFVPCINADGMGGLAGYSKKLRHIALEKFRHMNVHKFLRKFIAKSATCSSYQIEHDWNVNDTSSF